MPEKIITHELNQQTAESLDMLTAFTNVDFQRTRFWCLTSNIAMTIPRRLGPDASDDELAFDKKCGHKMRHNYQTLWRLFKIFMHMPPEPEWKDESINMRDPVMQRVGATVIWNHQVDYLIETVLRRMTKFTEFDYLSHTKELKKWYSKEGMLLEWELEALHRVKNFMNEADPMKQFALKTLKPADQS